jgi:hypothetical protein
VGDESAVGATVSARPQRAFAEIAAYVALAAALMVWLRRRVVADDRAQVVTPPNGLSTLPINDIFTSLIDTKES